MIKNIILDLGGVILNIDYQKTENEFIKLGFKNFNQLFSQAKQNNFFNNFETGKLPNEDFFDFFIQKNKNISKEKISKAWNAMLLDLKPEKIKQIKKLSNRYNLYLLSNTNDIHVKAFEKYIDLEYNLQEFKNLFKKVYYSNEIGLRKPNENVFDLVIKENKLNPKETLFIDDSPQHLVGAKKTGIKTLLHSQNELLKINEIINIT